MSNETGETPKTAIYLTNQEAEDFRQFCKYQQEIQAWHKNWQEVIDYSNKLQFGSFTLTIKDGNPVRIDKAMQQVVIGLGVRINQNLTR